MSQRRRRAELADQETSFQDISMDGVDVAHGY